MNFRQVALSSLWVATAVGLTASQQPSGREQVQKVRGVTEVRAATSEERFWAEYFDLAWISTPVMEAGHVSIPSARGENVPVPAPPGVEGTEVPIAKADRLQTFVCNLGAIVVGQAVAQRALLNRSETFFFTTYTVAVSEWIKPRGGNSTVEVALLGGVVQIGDRVFSSKSGTAPLLGVNIPVLLFLSRVPRSAHTFALHTPAVRVDRDELVTADLPDGLEDLSMVKSAATITAQLRAKYRACGDRQ